MRSSPIAPAVASPGTRTRCSATQWLEAAASARSGARVALARAFEHGGIGLRRRAAVEGWLRIVLDAELDPLGDLVAGHRRGQGERHVDTRRHACRRDDLALPDRALLDVARAVLRERVARRPVRGRGETAQ